MFVSNNDEEPYSSIFASLKHPVRRKILRMLSKEPMSYSEMLEVLGVSNSFLTYHLENLGELVSKVEDGKYRLSSFGEDAMATMTRVEDIPSNTTHQSPQTKPKKIVGKSVALVLGLICIVLIAFVAYFAVAGISAQNSYNNLQNQNKQLQTWLDGNRTLLDQTQVNDTNLQGQINSLNYSVTNLQKELNDFHIPENSTVWLNNESVDTSNSGGNIWGWGAPSAGYVSIQVSSNDNSTYVWLWLENSNSTNIYAFPQIMPISFEEQISVGFGRTLIIPVLPQTGVTMTVGSIREAKANVTVTYYY